LRAIATAREEAASVGTALAEAGANLTVGVAQVAAAALDSTLGMADEFWKGVDLCHLKGNRTVVRLAAPSRDSLHRWLAEGANGLVAPIVLAQAIEAVCNMTMMFPFVEVAGDHFDIKGSYEAWKIQARRLPSGYIGFLAVRVSTEFGAKWANPLWETLELDPGRQSSRLVKSIREAHQELPPLTAADVEITDRSLDTAALPPLTVPISWNMWALTRLLRAVCRSFGFLEEFRYVVPALILVLLTCTAWHPAAPATEADVVFEEIVPSLSDESLPDMEQLQTEDLRGVDDAPDAPGTPNAADADFVLIKSPLRRLDSPI
jgi:hypothetical protein